MLVDQERINLFADATLDHQWIHVEPERAKVESPSQEHYRPWIPHFCRFFHTCGRRLFEVNNLKMMVNYGMDKMRFGRPVLVNSRIRLVASLDSIDNLRGICQGRYQVPD